MTMIEKVARASFACWRKRMDELGHHLDKGHEFEDMTEIEMEFAFLNARAAIEAMRLSVDDPLGHELNRFADHDVWYWHNAMIDAALKETPK